MPTNLLEPRDRLIVALDFASAASALAHVERLEGQARWVKVGLELFLTAGPSIVGTLRERGLEVFLDLKLHDIPNTVAAAVRSAGSLGASLLTVHAAGGATMLAAAAEAAASLPEPPRLLAVTVLTSMDAAQLQATGVPGEVAAQVLRLALLAQSAAIPGLVCSSAELPALRTALPPETLLVVPGIRPHGAPRGDQHRIATPASAVAAGASMLVVGRPITQAAHPAAALAAIVSEMEQAQREAPPEALHTSSITSST